MDRFDDPLEGLLSAGSVAQLREFVTPEIAEALHAATADDLVRNLIEQAERSRRFLFMNCWHLNQYESAAMWRIYGDRGVAIRSTVGRLVDCFGATAEDVYVGRVNYVDHLADYISVANLSYASLSKSKSFSFEHELRAAVFDFGAPVYENGVESLPADQELPDGLTISVNVSALLERVYVAPRQPQWFGEVVRSVTDTYGFSDVLVEDSIMEQRPNLL